jgi:hypothetical protein
MKGHNSADEPARIELERLIVRLSAASKPPVRAASTSPSAARGSGIPTAS